MKKLAFFLLGVLLLTLIAELAINAIAATAALR
jgi:hypothetical protein